MLINDRVYGQWEVDPLVLAQNGLRCASHNALAQRW